MTMRAKSCFYILIAVLLLSSDLYAQQNVQRKTWNLTLGGYKEIPKIATPAGGTMTIRMRGDSLFVSGNFFDLSSDYFGAHIFYGENRPHGSSVFTLVADLNEDRRSGSFSTRKNRFKLNNAQKEYLLNGELFVAISSGDHQYGEIRSTIK